MKVAAILILVTLAILLLSTSTIFEPTINEILIVTGFSLFGLTWIIIIYVWISRSIKFRTNYSAFITSHSFMPLTQDEIKSKIPQIFYGNLGKIPFMKISGPAKKEDLLIFVNKYWIVDRQSMNESVVSNTVAKQLFIIFPIPGLTGYHTVYLKNPAIEMFKGVRELVTGSETPQYKVGDTQLDDNYYFLTKTPEEIRPIIARAKQPLLKLKEIFIMPGEKIREIGPAIDLVPASFELQFVDGYCLFRVPVTNPKLVRLNEIYEALVGMRSVLH